MNRVHVTKTILWMLTGLAAAVALTRFLFGLGAITHLTDATPWGLWIGFDVMAGVALAAGGFVITAIFYIMRQEQFQPMVRPAVLTAFLGYVAVILSLLVDLGLPWNIWHMMIYWNPHSPLFEVGWCVMLYTAVLLLEFSPVPLESASRWARIRGLLMKLRLPLVLLGIMLSTLHQSSLGSLFLIMPFKSHPLWYTPILPVLFLISAVALGLVMVCFESLVTAWLYRRPPERPLVARLLKAAIWVLALYLLVRIGDIVIQGKWTTIFAGTWESSLFMGEILLVAVIPLILFSIPSVRSSAAGQWTGSFMVVLGMIFNRVNVGGLTMVGATGDAYFPSWMEFAVTLGIIAFMALVFLFAVERFHIWSERPREPEDDPVARPQFSRAGEVWLGSPAVAARTKYSFAFIMALAFGFAVMPGQAIESGGTVHVPAQRARGGDTLFVDGNRDGYGVQFKHAFHIEKKGQRESCVLCHHMNLPADRNSGCYGCHRDMYRVTDGSRHAWHAGPDGAGIACHTCHATDSNRTRTSAITCDQCHRDLMPTGAPIVVETYDAPSYADAMHGLCITCHLQETQVLADRSDLVQCATCHASLPPAHMQADMRDKLAGPQFNHVVVPAIARGGR
jgi:Ni/Fe-hydrogenase subunit HybB-like protein